MEPRLTSGEAFAVFVGWLGLAIVVVPTVISYIKAWG